MVNLGAGLEGRGVIVTGAAGGIGSAVVRMFAACEALVMAVDIDESKVSALIDSLPGSGHVALAADLTNLSEHRMIIETAKREIGEIYVLAELAAVLRRRSDINKVTEEDWDFQFDVNLKSVFFFCRAAADEMIKQGTGGRIITFSSQGWWTGGFGGSVAYAATKGGVVSMTRGLARTYGPDGISVNSVAPGQISTPMLLQDLDPAVYEKMKNDTPLGYIGEPEEVAGVVVFLGSDHAKYISGATINVSGGFLMY